MNTNVIRPHTTLPDVEAALKRVILATGHALLTAARGSAASISAITKAGLLSEQTAKEHASVRRF